MRPQASDLFRDSPYYRRGAFHSGLKRCGYEIVAPKSNPRPDDVLLTWNRPPSAEPVAARYERAGATVIVVENGYVGRDSDGHILFAMALRHHNGAGTWPIGEMSRWDRLGIELEPWRRDGREVVVLPQRSIGEPGIAMPRNWPEDVVRRLRAVTDRPIRVRPHPGREKTDPKADLHTAWATVTWASGAGVKSIIYGVPAFHEFPAWIGASAARFGVEAIESPWRGDRLPMLRRLAWSQWSLSEIAAGDPFAALVSSSIGVATIAPN